MILDIAEANKRLQNKVDPEELPKLLLEAESIIHLNTMGKTSRVKYLTDHQVESLKEAIIDQIEYWIYIDPNMDLVGMPTSVNVEGVNMQYSFTELAPRSRRHLQLAGLLSRRVKVR